MAKKKTQKKQKAPLNFGGIKKRSFKQVTHLSAKGTLYSGTGCSGCSASGSAFDCDDCC